MKVIAADHGRSYDLPGLLEPARRPVDIDASNTGFTCLRSLRLYRFNAGSVIDGHAEEDEVFVVVTSGSLEMKIGLEDAHVDAFDVYTLTAPMDANPSPFAVYLPPHSVYQLTPHTTADVAYARATPSESRAPAVFHAYDAATGAGVTTLLEERAHRLRLKVTRLRADSNGSAMDLPGDENGSSEALVHLQGSPTAMGSVLSDSGTSVQLHPWETLVFQPGERATLHAAPGADLLILTVLAA